MSTIEAGIEPPGATGNDAVLVFTVIGKPSADEIVEAIHRHIGTSPQRRVLWDFLAADGSLLAREDLNRVLEASQKYASPRQRGRSAIVTRNRPTADRAIAVFDALKLAWTDAIEYRMFNDVDAAMAWLREAPPV